MSVNNTGSNMLLITSGFRGAKSFALVPITDNCPYVECLFDPSSNLLAVITKTIKGSYHMIPKLDDNGDPVRLKSQRRENGKTVKEQRAMVDTYSEFYVSDPLEIEGFIDLFAVNAKHFDYKQYIAEQDIKVEHPGSQIITAASEKKIEKKIKKIEKVS